MLVDVGPLHLLAQRRDIACFLQAFDGGLSAASQVDMPPAKSGKDNADDAGNDGKHNVIDGHERFDVGGVAHDLLPYPRPRTGKADPTEYRSIGEEQQKGFVVAQANAGCKPWAVMVHFQNAAATCRAVMGAVGLPCLTLFAKPKFAIGLDCKGGRSRGCLCRECTVAVLVGGAPRGSKDSICIAPVEKEVENDGEKGIGFPYHVTNDMVSGRISDVEGGGGGAAYLAK